MEFENWKIYSRLYDWEYKSYLQSYKHHSVNLSISTYIFSADITPEMLNLCRVTKVNVFFLVLVYVFNFDLFEFSAAISEKGLLIGTMCCFQRSHVLVLVESKTT